MQIVRSKKKQTRKSACFLEPFGENSELEGQIKIDTASKMKTGFSAPCGGISDVVPLTGLEPVRL